MYTKKMIIRKDVQTVWKRKVRWDNNRVSGKTVSYSKVNAFDDEDCSDAISETIVKAFSKIHTLKSEEYVDTWLVRILINECYNVIRQKKRVVSLEDYMMKRQTTEHKDYTDLYNAIGHLSENERICVSLYYLDGYKVKDIAEILKTTESAVKIDWQEQEQKWKWIKGGRINMKLEDLQSQFPKMPESMKVMVEKEVNKQIKQRENMLQREWQQLL